MNAIPAGPADRCPMFHQRAKPQTGRRCPQDHRSRRNPVLVRVEHRAKAPCDRRAGRRQIYQ